jgi:hypothetical protein
VGDLGRTTEIWNELIAGEYTHTTTVYQFNFQKGVSTKRKPPSNRRNNCMDN